MAASRKDKGKDTPKKGHYGEGKDIVHTARKWEVAAREVSEQAEGG